mgnify:CR=1 FL=1
MGTVYLLVVWFWGSAWLLSEHAPGPSWIVWTLAGPAFTVKGTDSTEKDETKRYKRLAMIKQMSFTCIEVRDAGTPVALSRRRWARRPTPPP